MNINEILAELDKMLENCEIERAGAYLAEQTDKALSSSENSAAITLLNEQIGYFRDCGKFKESLAACEKVLALIQKCGLESTPEHATTLLNAANARQDFTMRLLKHTKRSRRSTTKRLTQLKPSTRVTTTISVFCIRKRVTLKTPPNVRKRLLLS